MTKALSRKSDDYANRPGQSGFTATQSLSGRRIQTSQASLSDCASASRCVILAIRRAMDLAKA